MLDIIYQEIDKNMENRIVEVFGEWVTAFDCIHYEEGSYSIVALYKDKPIGFISTYPLGLPEPLQQYSDAYIDVIEVHEDFRRQGIAKKLLSKTEEWARDYGYPQIRSWSSDDKAEAIPMWFSFGYGVCPAIMRGESLLKEFAGMPIYGFYVSKVLGKK